MSDLSFEVAPGEILGLVGPNGAGKTTTIFLAGRSIGAALVAAWLVLSAVALAPVPLVGRAFLRCDVAADVPA